jgi:hypothetical protein
VKTGAGTTEMRTAKDHRVIFGRYLALAGRNPGER